MLTDREYSCVPSEQKRSGSITDTKWVALSSNLSIWSVIEPCISIIAACLPTLGPLIRDGTSLQSLIRSLHLRSAKRNRSTLIESNRSKRQVQDDLSPSGRAWHKFPEDCSNTSYSVGVELGKSIPPREPCFLKAIRVSEIIANDSEVPSPPLHDGAFHSIRVDRSFSTKSEQRQSL